MGKISQQRKDPLRAEGLAEEVKRLRRRIRELEKQVRDLKGETSE